MKLYLVNITGNIVCEDDVASEKEVCVVIDDYNDHVLNNSSMFAVVYLLVDSEGVSINYYRPAEKNDYGIMSEWVQVDNMSRAISFARKYNHNRCKNEDHI